MYSQPQKALIYFRVSSKRQKEEGHGLESQEDRCAKYAQKEGLQIQKVFKDSFTGGGDFMQRPAMREMVEYLDTHAHENFAIVFDDLKRFARDTEFHFKLRSTLKARNATPYCLNYTFDDTPEGEFVETIFAAQGQLERKQNKRQVVQKQKARLERGYWTFPSPPYYEYITTQEHGKILSPVQPMASVAGDLLRDYADGVFSTKTDFGRALQVKEAEVTGVMPDKFSGDKLKRILTTIQYAGYIEYPKWEVARRKGHHEAIIDLETYDRIQQRLNGSSQLPQRKDLNLIFPLRGYIAFGGCGKRITASESTNGSGDKVGYYRCNKKKCDCQYGGKSIRKDELEPAFEELLASLQPKDGLLRLTEAIFKDVWHRNTNNTEIARTAHLRSIEKMQKDVEKVKQLLRKAKSDILIDEYQADLEKLLIDKKQKESSTPQSLSEHDLTTALERTHSFIRSPLQHWHNGTFNDKIIVQKLVIQRPLPYTKNTGFGTVDIPLVYKVFQGSKPSKLCLVEVAGVEPASERELCIYLRL
jgi:site-specific DNA recombinase